MPVTAISEVTNHSQLLAALAVINLEVGSRQEDVNGLAAAAQELHARVLRLVEELKALNVDGNTVGNVAAVADALGGQSASAAAYASLTDQSAAQATTAARTAVANHGRIEQAVNDATVPMADRPFYTAQ